jgi:lysophospholipase L1-like esterase
MRRWIAGLLLVAVGAHAQESGLASLVHPPIRASKIVLVGDSTVAVQGGWGSSFCAEHVTSSVACVNLARGGRSTSSYVAEGSWALALGEARVPGYEATWILIQFGHNDQPGKPGRSTDLATEFPANLRRYVNEARAAGARPVLITSLTRRQFKEGVLENSLEPWAAATLRVAREMRVPCIDLNGRSSQAVQAMGPTRANEFASRPPTAEVAAAAARGTSVAPATATDSQPPSALAASLPGIAQPDLVFDYTHLGRTGADFFAAMMTHELSREIPELRPLLIL